MQVSENDIFTGSEAMAIADCVSMQTALGIPEDLKGFEVRKVTQMMAVNDLIMALAMTETREFWC
ncbi:MAG: hypothetical protein M0Z78_08920 [Betaproteobacteria bacterium]|nr:hypothetical protein [Betaproteobacteria bacterium]